MGKYVLILLATLSLGCLKKNGDVVANVHGVDICERTIIKDNHTYYMFVLVGTREGCLAVVHSEGCQCKKEKSERNVK